MTFARGGVKLKEEVVEKASAVNSSGMTMSAAVSGTRGASCSLVR